MRNWPGVLLVATIWAYWIGVGMMIVRVHRKTRKLGGLVPEQRLERAMWLVWVPLVAAWLTLPYLALVRSHAPLALPAFAQLAPYAGLRWIAAGCALGSLLLTSLCWSRMGTGWRMGVSSTGREQLITDGMFRYVRHPIYALSMLLMTCTAIVLPTVPVMVMAAVHLALLHLKARNEERHLLGLHGEAYRSYLARTGRFFPWLRTSHD
ncbi:MAG TPA: isoprenylcysteine carboxylmethyltransferase family protein [Casimicrobiaceae bacterium]|nr:isoprenylcysteine carboxylmethyltransferase family protein [Casimicrobiaceae bacterium]